MLLQVGGFVGVCLGGVVGAWVSGAGVCVGVGCGSAGGWAGAWVSVAGGVWVLGVGAWVAGRVSG